MPTCRPPGTGRCNAVRAIHPTLDFPNRIQRLSRPPPVHPHHPSPSSTISTSRPRHPAAPKPAFYLAPVTVPDRLNAALIAVVDDLCSFCPSQSLPVMPLIRSGWLARQRHFSVSEAHGRVYYGRLFYADEKEIGAANGYCLQVLSISLRIQ